MVIQLQEILSGPPRVYGTLKDCFFTGSVYINKGAQSLGFLNLSQNFFSENVTPEST